MADTLPDIAVDPDSWTEVIDTGSGYITNEGSKRVMVVEAASAPSVSVTSGHTLNPKNFIRYILGGSQRVFARSVDNNSIVKVTPD